MGSVKVEPNNLRAEMARYGITLEILSGELGLTKASISHKMTGKKSWTLVEAIKIRDYFNDLAGEQRHTVDNLFC